jgi:hypothetical protein
VIGPSLVILDWKGCFGETALREAGAEGQKEDRDCEIEELSWNSQKHHMANRVSQLSALDFGVL